MSKSSQTRTGDRAEPETSASSRLQRRCACGQHTGGGACTTCAQQPSPDRAAVPSVQQVLQMPGQPLDAATRAALEPRFGHDFSRVRVHTDAHAAASAQAVDALAYTVGQDVVFAGGQYQPATPPGQRLLAHELTHVVQQQGQPTTLQRRPATPEIDTDPLEQEAEQRSRGLGTPRPGGTLPYREAVRSLPAQHPAPPAALVPETKPAVLPAERARFDDLRGFVAALPAQVRALVAAGSASETWLREDNPNLQHVLSLLDRLVSDLNAERFVIRFDQPTGTSSAASYDYLNNEMHIRPFSGAAERTAITIDLVHEYTHIVQDREAEAAFARQRAPHIDTREEDLQQEIGARREQVYFGELLRLLRLPRPTDDLFGAQLSDMIFRDRFERERTGATPKERAAATGQIRSQIEKAYSKQLQTNSSFKRYAIELDRQNHALLYTDLPGHSGPIDLGAAPAKLASAGQLRGYLITQIKALPDFQALFANPQGQPFTTLLFSVLYNDRQVTEFGIQ